MPLEELIQHLGGGFYYYASDTQICVITSHKGNSFLSSDAVRLAHHRQPQTQERPTDCQLQVNNPGNVLEDEVV